MTTPIEESRKALKKAEKHEEAKQALVEEANKELVGTVRQYTYQRKRDKSFILMYVKKAEPARYGTMPSVTLTYEQVQALSVGRGRPGVYWEMEATSDYTNLCDMILWPVVQVEKFRQLQKLSKDLTTAFMQEMEDVCEAKWFDCVSKNAEEMKAPLDFPRLVLTKGSLCELHHSAYLLPDNRYLITPASLAEAREKVREETEKLIRSTSFFEECDMRYVRNKKESLRILTQELDQAEEELTTTRHK